VQVRIPADALRTITYTNLKMWRLRWGKCVALFGKASTQQLAADLESKDQTNRFGGNLWEGKMKVSWISLFIMIGCLIANSPTASAQCGDDKADCGAGRRTEQTPGIKVCNETSGAIWVAFAYVESGEWYSRGWWEIRRGECKVTITNILGAVYDYVRFAVM
jgi:hypothetical protein